MEKSIQAVGLFYNISCAFDTINNDLLLIKLYGIGVHGISHRIQKNRSLIMEVRGSGECDIGVPQRSILGSSKQLVEMNKMRTCQVPIYTGFFI